MNYQHSCDFLFGLIDYERKGEAPNFDLQSFKDFLLQIGSPHKKLKSSVLIAGTKGKGSTAAFISSCLHAAGYCTGLFTSPHLITPRERIKVNGVPISRREFAGLVTFLRPFIKEARQSFRTVFEVLTAAAFIHFARKKTDAVVLEVGMGGRLDATNVVRPVLSVITSISLDHTAILGNTLREIALEKSGIIKPFGIAISAPQPEEVRKTLQNVCVARRSELAFSDAKPKVVCRSLRSQEFEYDGERYVIPLLGEHQVENGMLAIDVIRVLNHHGFHVGLDHLKMGLEKTEWPGRMQILCSSPLVVVDGAHNDESALALRKAVKDYLTYDRLLLILGISRNKDLKNIIRPLSEIADLVILTRAGLPRAQSPEELLSTYDGEATVLAEPDIKRSLARAFSVAGKKDLILVTGSLYLVGETLALPRRHFRPKIPSLRRRS